MSVVNRVVKAIAIGFAFFAAVWLIGKLVSGSPSTSQSPAANGVTASSQPTAVPPSAVGSAAPSVSQPAADATSSGNAASANADWKSIVRTSAELATVPLTADYTALGWDELGSRFPSLHWSDTTDSEFDFVKQAFIPQGTSIAADPLMKPGVTLSIKGARTMIGRTEVSRFTEGGDGPDSLLSLFETALPNKLLLCDSPESAVSFERWYRVSPVGSKPVVAHYEESSGSAGTTETLTFGADQKMPKVGEDAISGKWTDKCKQ
jgi:hypothetical protein